MKRRRLSAAIPISSTRAAVPPKPRSPCSSFARNTRLERSWPSQAGQGEFIDAAAVTGFAIGLELLIAAAVLHEDHPFAFHPVAARRRPLAFVLSLAPPPRPGAV